jgi:hypothetical protein
MSHLTQRVEPREKICADTSPFHARTHPAKYIGQTEELGNV